MRVTTFAFLILINEALGNGGGGKHHVHFKIYVPEIIKHHMHTKTVFIHVHSHDLESGGKKKTVPKKKETHHEESHHEDWNSWSSYDDHGSHGQGHEHKHGGKDVKTSGKTPMHGGHLTLDGNGQSYGYENHPHKNTHSHITAYDPGQVVQMQMQDLHAHFNPHSESIQNTPQSHSFTPGNNYHHGGNGAIGYSYPPQYGMHHDHDNVKHVTEPSNENDIEPYSDSYEDGYRKGYESQTGHLLADSMKNFYDDKFEEGDSSNNGYGSESFDKYKSHEDLENHDNSGEHDGYNYDNGVLSGDSYHSAVVEVR